MRLKKSSLDNIVLITGAVFFLWFMLLPKPGPEWVYSDTIKYGATTLKGEMPFSDFAAMVVGFRALYHRTDPYPRLSEAFKELGIDWPVGHGSNHPPTSYLLAAPVALMPWPVASAVWAWMMLCLIVFSFRFYGLSWKMSLGLMPLTMLWPPASASLGQVTIVWMFGIALAYHFRKHRQFWSGASLGLASLSKYMPALLVIIYLLKRRWKAVLGFLSVWIFSLSLVTLLNSAAVPRYFEENRTTTFALMQRTDNSAPLIASYRYGGLLGASLLILFFALVVYVNHRYFLEWRSFPSTRVWMLLSYLAVACLPIFWIYSLMPLLPVIFYLIFRRKIATTILCALCILIPSIYIRGGEQSVTFIASVSVFLGLAFILDALPFKPFEKRWHSGLGLIDEMNPDADES
jgi:hypothetical protein